METMRLLVFASFLAANALFAEIITVTTSADSGVGSLRDALQQVFVSTTDLPDTIMISIPGEPIPSITLGADLPVLAVPRIGAGVKTVTIQCDGVNNTRAIINGAGT